MGARFLRRLAAASLVIVMFTSTIPSAAPIIAQQSKEEGSGSPPVRRGRNGQPVRSTPNQSNNRIHDTQSVHENNPDEYSNGQVDAGSGQSETTLPDSQSQGSPSRRREPPPFDRPPDNGRETGKGTDNQGDSPVDSKDPDEDVSDTATPDDGPDDQLPPSDSPDTTYNRDQNRDPRRPSSSPPVLRRPSDSRPRGEKENRSIPSSSSDENPTPQQADDKDEAIKLNATLVNIPILVSDRSGRYIPQLALRDFELFEDGTKQEVAFFANEEVPFNVALLLDVSPSVMDSLEMIQDAAIAFVHQLRPQDRVMVASFDHHVHFLTDFTGDRRRLEGAIRSIETGSGTSVYEAVYETVTRQLRSVEGRKALILFSDGEDTSSRGVDYQEAVNVVAESDVLVYGLRYPGSNNGGGGNTGPWPSPRTRSPLPIPLPIPFPFPWPRRRRGPFFNLRSIGIGGAPSVAVAASGDPQRQRRSRSSTRDFMTDVTAAAGGPVYDADTLHDLSRLARQIADELRHVYMISYYPTNPLSHGGYRSIRVHVKGRNDISVRQRRGYDAHEVENRNRATI